MFGPEKPLWRACYAPASEGNFTKRIVCSPVGGLLFVHEWMDYYIVAKSLEPPTKEMKQVQEERDTIIPFVYPNQGYYDRKGSFYRWWDDKLYLDRKEFNDNVSKTYQKLLELEGPLTIKVIDCDTEGCRNPIIAAYLPNIEH